MFGTVLWRIIRLYVEVINSLNTVMDSKTKHHQYKCAAMFLRFAAELGGFRETFLHFYITVFFLFKGNVEGTASLKYSKK